MQSIIEKYEAILKKPQPEPFKGYIEELLAALRGNSSTEIKFALSKSESRKAKKSGDYIKLEDASGFMPDEQIKL